MYELFRRCVGDLNDITIDDIENDNSLKQIVIKTVEWRENRRVLGGYATVRPGSGWIYAGHRLKILRVDHMHQGRRNGFSYRLSLVDTKFEFERGYRNVETLIPGSDLIFELPNKNDKKHE